MHRRATQIAERFFNDVPGYRTGARSLIREIADGWEFYSTLLDLPEWEKPISAREQIEIEVAKSGGK